jgi:hypothetical protein
MAEFAAAGGHWVLPTMDGMGDGQVRAHVSISVGGPGEVAEGDIDLAVEAGGESLQQLARPDASSAPLVYVSTRATTAVGFFVFANPNHATPTRATVFLRGEHATFEVGPPLVS